MNMNNNNTGTGTGTGTGTWHVLEEVNDEGITIDVFIACQNIAGDFIRLDDIQLDVLKGVEENSSEFFFVLDMTDAGKLDTPENVKLFKELREQDALDTFEELAQA